MGHGPRSAQGARARLARTERVVFLLQWQKPPRRPIEVPEAGCRRGGPLAASFGIVTLSGTPS
jgi:hypothetical protein